MVAADRRVFVRDVGVALGLYVLLLAAMRVQFQPLQVPGYLLVLGFDAIQNPLAPGLHSPLFEAALGLYLAGLAAVAAALAGRLRRRFGPAGRLRYGLAGAVISVGLYALAVLFAVFVPNYRGNVSPLLIAAAVGLAGLWAGMRLASWRQPAE
jgi:MFS family permease